MSVNIPHLSVDRTGTIRVGQSRVPLDQIVQAHRQAHTTEAILARFPGLSSAELQAALDYHLSDGTDSVPRGPMQRDAHWQTWNATAKEDNGTDTPPNEPIT